MLRPGQYPPEEKEIAELFFVVRNWSDGKRMADSVSFLISEVELLNQDCGPSTSNKVPAIGPSIGRPEVAKCHAFQTFRSHLFWNVFPLGLSKIDFSIFLYNVEKHLPGSPALHIYEVHTDHVSWINKKVFFFKRRVKILILFGDRRDHETSSNHFEEFLMQLMEWQLSIEAYFDTYNSAADAARVMHSMSCKSQRTSKSSGSTYFQIAAWIAFSQKSRCDKFSSCYCQRSTNTAGFRYQPFWMQDKWLTQSANSKKR